MTSHQKQLDDAFNGMDVRVSPGEHPFAGCLVKVGPTRGLLVYRTREDLYDAKPIKRSQMTPDELEFFVGWRARSADARTKEAK